MAINQPSLGDPQKVLEVTLGCKPGDVAENVIVTPFLPLKAFLRHVDPGTVKELAPRFFYKGFTALKNGKPLTVVLTGVGPSRVGDLVSLLSLTPAKRILFAGAVGALNPDWKLGEFLVAEEAADGEGYTRYATRPFSSVLDEAETIICRSRLGDELKARLEKGGMVAQSGKVFTIGSIAFEARANLALLAQRGYDAIEMELSAFFAAANHHDLEGAALAYVSDLPLTSSLWQEKSAVEKEALAVAWRLLPELAVEVMGG